MGPSLPVPKLTLGPGSTSVTMYEVTLWNCRSNGIFSEYHSPGMLQEFSSVEGGLGTSHDPVSAGQQYIRHDE